MDPADRLIVSAVAVVAEIEASFITDECRIETAK